MKQTHNEDDSTDQSDSDDDSSDGSGRQYWGAEASPDCGPPPPNSEHDFWGSDIEADNTPKTSLEMRGLVFQWGNIKLHIEHIDVSASKLVVGFIVADLLIRHLV